MVRKCGYTGQKALLKWFTARSYGASVPMSPEVQAAWQTWAERRAQAVVAAEYSTDLPPRVHAELTEVEAARLREDSLCELLDACTAPFFADDLVYPEQMEEPEAH